MMVVHLLGSVALHAFLLASAASSFAASFAGPHEDATSSLPIPEAASVAGGFHPPGPGRQFSLSRPGKSS
jgi:hypothetical protein